MNLFLWRPGWTGRDLIYLGDKDPKLLDPLIEQARTTQGIVLTGIHRGSGEVRTIDIGAEPEAGWIVCSDRQLDELGII